MEKGDPIPTLNSYEIWTAIAENTKVGEEDTPKNI